MSNIVWLARHGSREDSGVLDWWETAKRPHDPGLSKDGKEEAKKLGKSLKGKGINKIIASPYLRAVQTANFIAEEIEIPIDIEPGIGEILRAEWSSEKAELLTLDELKKDYSMVNTNYIAYTPETVYPEEDADLIKRIEETVKIISEKVKGNILYVGHDITIMSLINAYLKNNTKYSIGLCSVTKLVYKDKWEIEKLSDQTHLSKGR